MSGVYIIAAIVIFCGAFYQVWKESYRWTNAQLIGFTLGAILQVSLMIVPAVLL